MKWEIERITNWEEIYSSSFQEKWQIWSETAEEDNVFFHPFLSMAWLDTYRNIRNLKPLFCIAKSNETTIFLPLVLWRQNWKNSFRKIIIPVGYSDFDYHDPVISRKLPIDERISYFNSLAANLKFTEEFDAVEIAGLRHEINNQYFSKESETTRYSDLQPYITPESYLKTLKTSLRGDIRRQIRRISNIGPLSLCHLLTVNEALYALPRFLKLHSEKWPSAYKAPDFHRNLILRGLESGLVSFTLIKCGDRILGYHLGFSFKNKFYYYMPVTDPGFENLSPGKIHLFKLVEYAIENHYLVFDHLRGDESYKSGWTDKVQPLFRFSCKNSGAGSGIRNLLYSLKQKIT